MPELPEIPATMRSLPLDRRGYPIPVMVFHPKGGEPDFRVIDREKTLHCMRFRLCGLCGRPLDYWLWFIGGPICKRSHHFTDPAMHEACARFAAAACPYIARSESRYSGRALPEPDEPGRRFWVEPSMANHTTRPAEMYLFKARRYEIVVRGNDVYAVASSWAVVETIPTAEAPHKSAPKSVV